MVRCINIRIIAFGLVVLSIVACGPSEPQLAVDKLNLAESLLASGDTVVALQHLDSIPAKYPKAKVEVRKTIQLNNRIVVSMMMERRNKLQECKAVIDTLASGFVAEKGEFERLTNYIPVSQNSTGNWSKSFLKMWLNEKGDLFLSSNYYGAIWLNHYAIRIYNAGLQVQSDSVPVGDPYNYHGDFNGMKWERITFRPAQSEPTIRFIAENYSLPLKALFIGKQQSAIIMEERDKKAAKMVVEYADALKVKIRLEAEIAALQARVKPDGNE
jgi:hypothetical protein